MSGPIVPYGALPGVSLQAELREVAAYYGIPTRALMRSRPRAGDPGDLIGQARQALFWKLTEQRKIAPAKVARMTRCTRRTVVRGAAEHKKRILEFASYHMLKPMGVKDAAP